MVFTVYWLLFPILVNRRKDQPNRMPSANRS